LRQSRQVALYCAVALAIAIPFVAMLAFWAGLDGTRDWTASVPGMDNQPPTRVASIGRVSFGSWHRAFDSPAEKERHEGFWPGFRGPRRDNRAASLSGKPLAVPASMDESLSGARLLWQRTLGEGHAAPAVFGTRVYLLDYDEDARRELVRAFRLSDGEELWQTGYPCVLKRNHGFTRSVPAVTETSVITLGAEGHVMALNVADGTVRWGIDLVNDWKAAIPSWYTAQCPLVDNGTVVLAPASTDAMMIGLDETTGKLLWKAPNPQGWKLSHSSVMKARLGGVDQYVYAAIGGLVGVAAGGAEGSGGIAPGTLLWSHPFSANVVAPSPLVYGNRILQSAGYGAGSVCLEVTNEAGEWRVREIARYVPSAGLASEQQTPIAVADDLILSVQPKDAGAWRDQLVAAGPSGEILWSSGSKLRLGLGPYALAGDRLFALNDDGELFMIRVGREGWTLLDRRVIIEQGQDAWGPLVLTASGILLARDSTRLVCYELWEE